MIRWFTFGAVVFSLRLLMADDVSWLQQVNQSPPVIVAEQPGRLDDLLASHDGQKISTIAEWNVRKNELRREWQAFLGPMPDPRPEIQLEVLQTEILDGITRQLIRYEGEPAVFVEAYLLLPAEHHGQPEAFSSAAKLPAIVALHATTNVSIDEIAGVSGPDTAQIGLKLARRGFVVLCPRCFLWQNASSLNDAVDQHTKRHPETKGMAKMLYDAQRGVDVLQFLPCVDDARIGAVGHSLGAKETLYLAAFDDRIQASVASEGGLGFRSTNWDAPWYLGNAIHDDSFPLNHHQLIAMIAPGPFLVLGGESGPGAADGDRSWAILQPAMPVWRLYEEPVRLGLLNHHQGHSLSPESFERMAEWLKVYLSPDIQSEK